MRTTIVPAQITTVEDKIAGDLTLHQIFLLLLPLFLGGFLYISFPPQVNLASYKIVIFIALSFLSGTLALRVKEKMVISWGIVLLRYITRPKYFLFNKNDPYQRQTIQEEGEEEKKAPIIQKATRKGKVKHPKIQSFSTTEAFKLEQLMRKQKAAISFTFEKRGGIYVSFSKRA